MSGFALACILVCIAFYVFVKTREPSKATENELDGPWPFYSKRVFTETEQVLYQRLVKAFPDCIILGQVQLSRFLGVKRGKSYATWGNRISRQSIDFLVCRKDSSVIMAIELDDGTHLLPARMEADKRKNKALADGGIRLFRMHVTNIPSASEIRTLFENRVTASTQLEDSWTSPSALTAGQT